MNGHVMVDRLMGWETVSEWKTEAEAQSIETISTYVRINDGNDADPRCSPDLNADILF